MKKTAKVKVTKNIWGNYSCHVGRERVQESIDEWSALQWLKEQVAEGKEVSDKSYLGLRDVE